MRLYADSAAYAAYTGEAAPANVDVLLRTASRVVDVLLVGRAYDTDPDTQLPTDPDEAQAMSDATCAIAQEADSTGVLTAGGSQEWDAVGIGSVSLSGRKAKAGTVSVNGIAVPPVALVHLSDVGVWSVVAR